MIAEGWYDREFIRDWSNGAAAGADDSGRFLTAADLDASGAATHHVAWDQARGRPVIYDPAAGRYAERLRGSADARRRSVRDAAAARSTAVRRSSATRRSVATIRPSASRPSPACPPEQIVETARLLWERRPVAYFHWTGLEQHTNASQTVRAMSLLYALTGCWDAPGGNVRPTRPAANDLAPLALLSEAQRAKALGLAERPLGPARLGWTTGVDAYRAILHGTPYPRAGDGGLRRQPAALPARRRARRARRCRELDFLVYADLFLTPTAALADVVLPVSTAWEREGLRVGFGPTHAGERHVQLRPRGRRAPGRVALGHLDHLRAGPAARARRSLLRRRRGRRPRLHARAVRRDADGAPRAIRRHLGAGRASLPSLRDGPGRRRRWASPRPSRRVEIYAGALLEIGQAPLPDYVEPAASPVSRPDLVARYPLVLTTAKVVQFCHSQHRSLPRLRRHSPDPQVELHPSAAQTRGIVIGRLGGDRNATGHDAGAGATGEQPGPGRGVRAVRVVAGVRAAGAAGLRGRGAGRGELQRADRHRGHRSAQWHGAAALRALRGSPPANEKRSTDAAEPAHLVTRQPDGRYSRRYAPSGRPRGLRGQAPCVRRCEIIAGVWTSVGCSGDPSATENGRDTRRRPGVHRVAG